MKIFLKWTAIIVLSIEQVMCNSDVDFDIEPLIFYKIGNSIILVSATILYTEKPINNGACFKGIVILNQKLFSKIKSH